MKFVRFLITICIISCLAITGWGQRRMDQPLAEKLARLPLRCIDQEYPNKTSHSAETETDARLSPRELHPSFYGCFDWHSSVHGHWMLIRLLGLYPDLPQRDSIIRLLEASFDSRHIREEAAYFSKYKLGKIYERTYGWAWLLKLDQELYESQDPLFQQWHRQLQPLTRVIVNLWKEYLPKQTYPNRTGVHPNSAFAMGFALDWARAVNDDTFARELIQKANDFYLDNVETPAYLEPDGSDFFSPSLCIADLMSRVLPGDEFTRWLESFYTQKSIDRICEVPHVSDRMDYQITHLDGLMLSRAWNMRRIMRHIPSEHALHQKFLKTSDEMLAEALNNIDKGNYGGEHWLASFAVYALTEY